MSAEWEILRQAVDYIASGRLVAFPTETVYGLGADATNSQAVRRIFAAKGRPGTNPLIVHVADAEVARRYAKIWPQEARALSSRFWPGPLTLVVFKSDVIVPEVSAGRDTVGLRAPDHPLALQLLRAFDGPVAAPSANRSNRISPTTAEHVRRELGDAVDLILDGGSCKVGIESTVLDLTTTPPSILRPGAVAREQIESVIGPVDVAGTRTDASASAKSPGQHRVHYSPSTPAYRLELAQSDRVTEWLEQHPNDSAGLLAIEGSGASPSLRALSSRVQWELLSDDPSEYARALYAALRSLDASGAKIIFIQMPPPEPPWNAVRDRLMRASRPL
jgi:L-threonylcarbamoyladenylate synthase